MSYAKVLKKSVSRETGVTLTSFELEYPRMIHSELMTHRMFSRNAASSRAVPVKKMITNIQNNKGLPVYWGKEQSGMQSARELTGIRLAIAKLLWHTGIQINLFGSRLLSAVKLHKQLTNRNTEYCSNIKIVLTATEFDNWYELRAHEEAQPEIQELANLMAKASFEADVDVLNADQWHLPYVDTRIGNNGVQRYFIDGEEVSLKTAQRISASCCAQVSYRSTDMSIEKAERIYSRLVGGVPRHSSPFEHQGTPMDYNSRRDSYGVTHQDIYGNHWSGNLREWVQFRQLIDSEVML